jgi:hypothetical protein
VILQSKLDEENPTNAGLAQEKWFWLCIIVQVAMAGKVGSSALHLQQKRV